MITVEINKITVTEENCEPKTIRLGQEVDVHIHNGNEITGKIVTLGEDSLELDVDFSYQALNISYEAIIEIGDVFEN